GGTFGNAGADQVAVDARRGPHRTRDRCPKKRSLRYLPGDPSAGEKFTAAVAAVLVLQADRELQVGPERDAVLCEDVADADGLLRRLDDEDVGRVAELVAADAIAAAPYDLVPPRGEAMPGVDVGRLEEIEDARCLAVHP